MESRRAETGKRNDKDLFFQFIGSSFIEVVNHTKPSFIFPGFADHVLVPGRVPDELDLCFINSGYR